jgi:predicted glycosyltransferase
MSRRERLLFHCQHSLGLGHLVRSYALAAALGERFDVTLARGGAEPAGIEAPAGIEIVQLPELAAGIDGALRSSAGDVSDVIDRRRAMLLECFERLAPAVIVVELFPFGRMKLASELLPLLEAAAGRGCRIVCSVRDILVDRGSRQAEHDERACLVLNAFFDAVLVHADPAFARLEDSFRPATELRVPVEYTGFVAPPPPATPATLPGKRRVLVSAGGGAYGEQLLATTIRARPHFDPDLDLRVIAGPFAADATFPRLRRLADGRAGLELIRHVPDLEAELAAASASVSQCGYNTALALLRARIPALVVPFSEGGENEQARRAARLGALGAVRVLDTERLHPRMLAREIEALTQFVPAPVPLRIDGAQTSAEIIDRVARGTPRRRTRGDWLRPLRDVLATRETPATVFFRDDDAGWHTSSLLQLLDLFENAGAPLDLAAIPAALESELATELLRRVSRGARIGIHQHGFAHVNHEATGRKCEFGPARDLTDQRADIAAGRERLRGLLGPQLDSIFTPPWNRCTEATARCLEELGFDALSRDATAEPLDIGELVQLPVRVDWFGPGRKGRTRAELALAVAAAIAGNEPVGVMLHHGDLGAEERRDTAALLGLLGDDPGAVLRPMRAILGRDPNGTPTRRQECIAWGDATA